MEGQSVNQLEGSKRGDLVVVGREGIQVLPPERPRGKKGVFEFMSSDASSEKPIKSIIKKISSEIKEVKNRGGKIAVVSGPAVVHTGSGPISGQYDKRRNCRYYICWKCTCNP